MLSRVGQYISIDTYKANHDIHSIIKGIQVCRDNIDEVGL